MKELEKYKEEKNTNDVENNIFAKIFVSIIISLFILLLPLVYPIVSKILINLGFFSNIEEILNFINIFKGIYMIPILIVIACIFFYILPNKGNIFNWVEKLETHIKNNNADVDVCLNFAHRDRNKEEIMEESMKNKEDIEEQLSMFRESDLEKKQLKLENSTLKSDLEKVCIERDDLRFFAAYSISNTSIKKILKKLYPNEKISIIEVYNYLENIYYKKIRYIYGEKRKKRATDKVSQILQNLIYLNIIEYTEDGEYIILTNDGRKFVEGFMEGEK